jgi:hypothetical protein
LKTVEVLPGKSDAEDQNPGLESEVSEDIPKVDITQMISERVQAANKIAAKTSNPDCRGSRDRT